jgi:uncharacterized protein (UPF0276 family)
MPLDNVVQVHLAGGYWHEGVLIDGHSHPVPPEVWELAFGWLGERVPVKASLLEFDQNFPDFSVLIDQVSTARQLMSASAPDIAASQQTHG